jgi:2-hydroxycyclohexanecarboxyl-CoA dehydrogenase
MATICSSRSRSTRSTVTVTPSTVVSKGIADLDPGAAETSAELTAEDGTVIGLGTDVTERPQIRAAVGSRDRAARATDLLVNCAGVDGFELFLKISDESWNRIIAVNLTGTFAFCQEVVPHILDARWGRIVGA